MRGKSNNRFKLTAKEKGWILYDVGNSGICTYGINYITNIF